jgi:ABC-type transport system involved in cytochrome bd biosynthesis fused ATPase/permease subunit
MKKYLSTADFTVIVITFLLFLLALFIKGFTQSLLLEAGVLLVSVKIILMNYKNNRSNQKILSELEEIKGTLMEIKNSGKI